MDSKPAQVVVIDDQDNTENYSILRRVENTEADTEAVSDVSFSVFGSNIIQEDLTRSESIKDNKDVSTDLPWLTTCISVQIKAQIYQEKKDSHWHNRNEEVNIEQEDLENNDKEIVTEWPWLTKHVQVSEEKDSYGPYVVPGNSFLQDGCCGQYVVSGDSFPKNGSCGRRLQENLSPQAQNNSCVMLGITSPHDGSYGGQYVISGYSFSRGTSRCAVPEDLFPQWDSSCGQCVVPENTFPHDSSCGQYVVSGDSIPVDLFSDP